MPGTSDGKMDEHAKYWAATDGSSQGSTVAQPSRSDTARSITPKGTLFPNLGEAHQAITSKLASQSAGNNIPEEESLEPLSASISDVSSSTASILSARKLEFTKPSGPPQQRCLTPFFGTTSRNAERNKKTTNTAPVDSSFGTQSPGPNLIHDTPSIGAGEQPASSEALAIGGSIGLNDSTLSSAAEASSSAELPSSDDVHQAQTLSSLSPMSISNLNRSAPRIQSVNPRSPDIRRTNTSIDPGKRLWDLRHPTTSPPQRSLPELPYGHGDSSHPAWEAQTSPLKFGLPSGSFRAVSGSENGVPVSRDGSHNGLTTASLSSLAANHSSDVIVPRQASSGLGRPLPFPPREDPKDRCSLESDGSQGAAANTRLSIDSDDDPFKYDQGSFSVFLRPSREREVSAALRCVSQDSTVSARAIFDEVTPSPEAGPLGPAPNTNNPFVNGLHSYQTSTLGYNWDYEEDPSDFRIAVRSPPVRSSPVPASSPVQPTIGFTHLAQGRPRSQRLRDGIDTLLSEGPDWETIVASVGKFASLDQFDSNRAIASSTRPSRSHSMNVAGNSVADCSDTSSVHAPEHDAFSSRERILQHPATDYTPGARNPRTLEDTGRPVFLPKPRIHRVNGYLHNSHRVFTDPTAGSSATSTRSALVEKLSASIRSRHERKRAHRLLQQEVSRSKFQSLGSISSEYSEESCDSTEIRMAGSGHVGGPQGKPGTARPARSVRPAGNAYGGGNPGHKAGSGRLASTFPREPTTAHLKGHHSPVKPRRPANEQFGLGSPTLFNFPLISLEEAAQRAALNRENDDNLTVTSGVRTRKNSSVDSSKATQRTTPPTPHLMKPGRIHSYRPSSASILGIPVADRRGYTRYSQGTKRPPWTVRVEGLTRSTLVSRPSYPLPHHTTAHLTNRVAERIAMGHDRGISNVTSYKSGTPLVPGRSAASSRVSRTPFDCPIMGGGGTSSMRSSSTRHPFSGTFYGPPCLVPRDRRPTMTTTGGTSNASRGRRGRRHHNSEDNYTYNPNMTHDLRQIISMEAGHFDVNPTGFLATGDGYMSWEARQRRQAFYYLMIAMCVLPFTAPLVWAGTADTALSWYTRGEVASLTPPQRKRVPCLGCALCVMWLVVVVGVVVYIVGKKVGGQL